LYVIPAINASSVLIAIIDREIVDYIEEVNLMDFRIGIAIIVTLLVVLLVVRRRKGKANEKS
jgi:hypothetical protein